MIPRVVEVKALPNFCLWVRFLDGTSGTVELAHELPIARLSFSMKLFKVKRARLVDQMNGWCWDGSGPDSASIGMISLRRRRISCSKGSVPPRLANARAFSCCSEGRQSSAAELSDLLLDLLLTVMPNPHFISVS
jgi:hypothetical protein